MRDIIPDGVSEDMGQRVGFGDVAPRRTDDGDEFAFIVEARRFLGHGGHGDGVVGPRGGGDGFVEEDRVFGEGEVGLGGVRGVVEPQAPDGADVRGGERAQEPADGGGAVGEGG